MEKEEFQLLAEKIYQGTASKEEIAQYNHYYMYFQKDTEWDNDVHGDQDLVGKEIFNDIDGMLFNSKKTTYKQWISIAAMIVVVFTVALYFYLPTINNQLQVSSSSVIDIAPGSDKAVLTLADGSKVLLDQIAHGEISEQNGVRVNKSEDGLLVYEVINSADVASVLYNTISIPRGGQYKVVLPDGTNVWLNSASSLRYPANFDSNTRQVELDGEAYFEVAERRQGGKNVPFVVFTQNQEVEVLGTHFNISSYREEKVTKTTLLEGKVRVNLKVPNAAHDLNWKAKSVVLNPNQQSSLPVNGKDFIVADVNTEESVAWKNGLFIFNDESLGSIMRKISRWYDVDVVFEGADPNRVYWGSISRFENVSEVLNTLELTGSVRFEIVDPSGKGKERRIVVMK